MDVIGLIFDGDDVLYDATAWRRWLLRLLAKIGLHTHYQPFFRVWERDYMPEVNEGRRDYWNAMRAYLGTVGLTFGQIDEVIAASHARRRRFQQNARPLPGVLSTVMRLSGAGLPMAVLNNVPWPAQRSEQMFANMGLARQFSVVTSFDLGSAKPAPECYHAAVAALGLNNADQVGFVGHDSMELAGAARVGMPTIAVNCDPDAVADVHLESIGDLCSAINYSAPRLQAG